MVNWPCLNHHRSDTTIFPEVFKQTNDNMSLYHVNKWADVEHINWAHRYVDKHTTHKIDHTMYSAIEEWNNEKWLATVNAFINKKSN